MPEVKLPEVQSNKLQTQLRDLNDRTQQNIDALKSLIVGRVLTITDATVQDPAQRKAVKDLINQAVWDNEYWSKTVRDDIKYLAQAHGFADLGYTHDSVPGPDAEPYNPFN